MLSRIMNYLLSGTDLPERFQIPVLYRNSFALSIGILHKFRPSFFTWSAMKNLSDLQYPPHSFLPHAPRKQQKTAAHAHNTCSAAILSYLLYMYSHPAHTRTSYLSFEARATSPLSARSARTFGMTISPLKKSAKDHTSSSFRQEPITMQTTTISE